MRARAVSQRLGPGGHGNLRVEDRCSVDCLERVDVDARGRLDVGDGAPVEPDWVRSVWRAGREDSGERDPLVVRWMCLLDTAVGLVQPPHHDHPVPGVTR